MKLRSRPPPDYTKCLRYELGLETARRELAEAEVARLTESRATERDALRAELRMERAHSARCDLEGRTRALE